MKLLLALLLSLTLAGGALLTWGLSSSSEVRGEPSRAVQPGADVTLGERLARLEERLADVVERLDGLERRQNLAAAPAPSTRAPLESAGAPSGELLEVEDSLRELAAALDTPGAAPTPKLESLVLSVVEQREAREAAEREEQRLQRVEDEVTERMVRLRQELGLDDRQAETMRGLLVNQTVRRDEIFDRMRQGEVVDRREIRDELRTLRDDTNAELQVLLSPAQYERYGELQRTEFDDRGWGGGPRGGSGGGRRGGEEGGGQGRESRDG